MVMMMMMMMMMMQVTGDDDNDDGDDGDDDDVSKTCLATIRVIVNTMQLHRAASSVPSSQSSS